MITLESTISQLSDKECIHVLRRLLTVFQGFPSKEIGSAKLAIKLGRLLSIDSVQEAPTTDALARYALLALALDPQVSHILETLLAHDSLPAFSSESDTIDTVTLLSLIEDQAVRSSESPNGVKPDIAPARTLAQQVIAYEGLSQPSNQSDAEFRVWYATSRRPIDPSNPATGYGVERDTCIHYGSCDVFVPRSHKIGSVGSPWWKRLLTMTDDRLKLLSVEEVKAESFWASMHQQLANCEIEDRDAVVFIHGFNVSFEEAALRAAQLGFDLQVRGAMAFYSWASRGEVMRYPADEAAIELDESPIADFLCDFAQRSGARRVHVIAHSMGNRAVLRAADRIASNAERRSGIRFGQFILAAPDVDARKFLELCPAYPMLAERTTLYVSDRDYAVGASEWLHDFPRAGLMPPVITADGIDTVNVTNADITLLGHGYVAETRDVVSDIHALIERGNEPVRRFGLRAALTTEGKPYWLIGA